MTSPASTSCSSSARSRSFSNVSTFTAKLPPGRSAVRDDRLLRTLLEERFVLRTHTERRDIPVYALTVARPGRLGRNLRETTTDCSRFDRRNEPADSPLGKACSNSGRRDAQKSQLRESGPIALFMERLANQGVLDRPLEDRTGLTGLFEWDLTFRVDRNPASDSEAPPHAPLLFRGRHPYL